MAKTLIEQMARALKRPADRVEALVIGAPGRYRTYTIPKKGAGRTRLIAELCRRRRVRYTRYAEVLTFSGKSEAAFGQIGALIRRTRVPRLTVHADKTVFSSKGTRRETTGLTLTPDGKLSIGRDRKALIREQLDRYRRCRLPDADSRKLGGLIAFAQSMDSDFVRRLTRKHGVDLMDRIRTGS